MVGVVWADIRLFPYPVPWRNPGRNHKGLAKTPAGRGFTDWRRNECSTDCVGVVARSDRIVLSGWNGFHGHTEWVSAMVG